ncbi:WAS/WASL-interacting protein family member 2 [Dissostichus eleginoides]|uniref:WAS/WASL-interacting protein family member 2 n=1 Tax=Dissostichus eleginoides TaxID=100907 RepID=A0AAD9B6R3_DISEL|nr:WAS/WASL-interacting protein family member 2 [Dissostichus eleginoides]
MSAPPPHLPHLSNGCGPQSQKSGAAGANGSAAGSPSGAAPPIGGLFPGRSSQTESSGRRVVGQISVLSLRAPRPPSHRHDDAESPSPQTLSPLETPPPTPPHLRRKPRPLLLSGSAPRPAAAETAGRGAAPPVPAQPLAASLRGGAREAPPPPPYRTHDDFESKYSFHPLDDFPPPEEYRHFAKIYPSKANRVMRGAPPLPPVGR